MVSNNKDLKMENFWLFYKYFFYRIYKLQIRNKSMNPILDAHLLLSIIQSSFIVSVLVNLFPYDRINDQMKYLNLNIIGVILLTFTIFLGTLIIIHIKVYKNIKKDLDEIFEKNPNIPNGTFDFLIFLHFFITLILFIIG